MANITNGTVSVVVTGGVGPYQYTLLNAGNMLPVPSNAYPTFTNPVSGVLANTFTFGNASDVTGNSGLQAGSYKIKIVDANGCETFSDTLAVSDASPTPTATPVATPVPPTATPVLPTATPEPTATEVPPTATPAPTAIEPTATPAPTAEPTPTATGGSGAGPTPTPTAVLPTATPAPTAEPTATPAPTAEPTATPVPTAEPTATPAPTAEPTATPVPTAEPTATPAPTAVVYQYYSHAPKTLGDMDPDSECRRTEENIFTDAFATLIDAYIGARIFENNSLSIEFDGDDLWYDISDTRGGIGIIKWQITRDGRISNIVECPVIEPTPTPEPTATERPVDPTATPTPEPTATERPVDPTATPTPEPTATERPVDPTPTPTGDDRGSVVGFYFHGGNSDYPYAQAEGGLTDPDVGDLYYNDGDNAYAIGDLSQAMSYILDNSGSLTYPINQFSIPANGIEDLGTSDVLTFPATSNAEYYYIVLPSGQADLTSGAPLHLSDGGIETRAVEKAQFMWNNGTWTIYRLGFGSLPGSKSIAFSDND